jgi:FKBP-type peptidyl-prolyl cis-trans isomerase FkpA
MRLRRLAAVLLLPIAFTACLEGTDTSTNPFPNVPIEQTTFAAGLNVNLAQSTKTATGLYYRDLTVGTGNTATGTSQIGVYYTGFFPNGQKFDERASPSAPLVETLGQTPAKFIKGWEEGIVGMKVGGTRQLIVPPELAYGASGYGVIPPNQVLVFTVILQSAQ